MTPMEKAAVLRSVGGRSLTRAAHDGEGAAWNFGLQRADGSNAEHIDELPKFTGPGVHDVAKLIRGHWDGKRNVSGWLSTQKVLGKFLEAQAQKIGSCGGAATSGGLNVQQCNQIVAGTRQDDFKHVSRAWCYVGARTLDGIRGQGEGVIPPAPLNWVKEHGAVCLEELETGEKYDSDEVAKNWDKHGLPKVALELAIDNLISDMAPCYTFEEAADVIDNGGVVMVASDQGFTMTRDSEGVCQPEGEWMHYMYFASVHHLPSGRDVLGCGQSWGPDTPSGPMLPGCPDYVFGVERKVVNRMLGQKTSTAVSGFVGWSSPYKPWIF